MLKASDDGNRYVVNMIYGRYGRITRHYLLQPLSIILRSSPYADVRGYPSPTIQ